MLRLVVSVFVLVAAIFVLVACAGKPSPPTPDLQATVTAVVEAIPTQTPYPTSPPPTQFKAAPTLPTIREFADRPQEFFAGAILTHAKRGRELLDAGNYQAAVDSYKEATRLHGEPSYVLETALGSAYSALGMYSLAIEHQSSAIAIRDDAVSRTNRGFSYVDAGLCGLAVSDAQEALLMESYSASGFHTDVRAYSVLAVCAEYSGDHPAALEHLEVVIKLAIQHHYGAAALSEFQLWREDLQRTTAGRP